MSKKSKNIDRPIAILTIKQDVSKMDYQAHKQLIEWIYDAYWHLRFEPEQFGKCRFRLMRKESKP